MAPTLTPDWIGDSHSGAELSQDQRYRYVLWRVWDWERHMLGVVMLNPSTADAMKDDATIRVVVGRAKQAGYGGILVGNLYAYRATSPADMWREGETDDIVGPSNDETLERIAEACLSIWCAWGANAMPDRVRRVVEILTAQPGRRLLHVGLTKAGQPKHPLRIPYTTPLMEFSAQLAASADAQEVC